MKFILVTGANSQLGKTLRYLNSRKLPKANYLFYNKQDLDITDDKQIKKVFNLYSISHCINCAAYTDVDGAELNKEKALKINAYGVKKLSEACKEFDVTLIHISTDYVFDGKSKIPYTTKNKPNPLGIYGKSKLQGELVIRELLNNHYIIRTSWLYSIYENNFLSFILKSIRNRDRIKVTTEAVGSPTSSESLAKFIFFIVEEDRFPFGTYHFSNRGHVTWYGFAKEIEKYSSHLKTNLITPIDKYITQAKRPEYSVLNLSKTLTYYKTIETWQEALKETLDNKNALGTTVLYD